MSIKTRIRYYGMLTELAATEVEEINLEGITNSTDLQVHLKEKYPAFSKIPVVLFQNRKLCQPGTAIQPGIEIDCMPPFSGG